MHAAPQAELFPASPTVDTASKSSTRSFTLMRLLTIRTSFHFCSLHALARSKIDEKEKHSLSETGNRYNADPGSAVQLHKQLRFLL
jgi:hypothetical protein